MNPFSLDRGQIVSQLSPHFTPPPPKENPNVKMTFGKVEKSSQYNLV